MKAIVLLNDSAGRMSAADAKNLIDSIKSGLHAANVEAEMRIVSHRKLYDEAKRAAESAVDVVVAGGGDGTLSTVAGALAGTGKLLGVLPLGTLNHFAKDLNIPLELAEACRVIGNGNHAAIDVGAVNDRVFINNSSLGVYPRAVLERETQQRHHGLRKWTAMFVAVLKTFRRFPLMGVRLETNETTILRRTPLVFVGNNRYQLDLLNVGKRACLDEGKLSLYIANTQSRWRMLILTLRAMIGRLRQAEDFETACLNQCWIETRRKRLHIAIDGEVVELRPPLHYRIWPEALQVLVPLADDVNSQSMASDSMIGARP